MASDSEKALKNKCDNLAALLQDGIQWTLSHVGRDHGQGEVVSRLKELRRRSRRLSRAAETRPGIGVFGASQHGKSYLVSNMVRRGDGIPLEVVLPPTGQRVDFKERLNPEGDQESTGTVTRFTTANQCPSGQPGIQLELLSQADVVAILADGYLGNVQIKDVVAPPDASALQAVVTRLRGKTGGTPRDGLTEDDIADLRDYIEERFPGDSRITDLRRLGYWEHLAAITPGLPAADRVELFEWLWECVPALSDVLRKLTAGLAEVDYGRYAATDTAALMPKLDENGAPLTILDVRVVIDLAQASSLPPVSVVAESGRRASLSRSVLTALVKEVILPLPPESTDQDHLRFLKDMDVLDFPGARSSEILAPEGLGAGHNQFVLTIKEIFVRGKVSFLFNHYDNESRVNALVIGVRDQPLEVKSLPVLVYRWIAKNLGDTPASRVGKDKRLFIAFNFFNNQLMKRAETVEAHSAKWAARIGTNLVEAWQHSRGSDRWLTEWVPGRPFNNCFFIRDPRYSQAVFESEGNGVHESGVRHEFAEQLRLMERSFLDSPLVRRHVADPAHMWAESTQPNRSGCQYLLAELGRAVNPADHAAQLQSEARRLVGDIDGALRALYHSEDKAQERENAEKNARAVGGAMWQALQKGSIGLLLEQLYLPEDVAWTVYYGVENPALPPQPDEGGEDAAIELVGGLESFDPSDIFSWADSVPTSTPTEPARATGVIWNKADAFSDTLIDRWFGLLSDFAENLPRLGQMSVAPENARILVNGIKEAAQRVRLRDRLRDLVKPGLDSSNSHLRIDLYARIAAQAVNDFVNDFDWRRLPEAARPTIKVPALNRSLPIFALWNSETPKVEELIFEEGFGGITLSLYWIQGLYSALLSNAEEVSFDVAANARLGEILKRIEQAA